MERDGHLVLHTAGGSWTLSPQPGCLRRRPRPRRSLAGGPTLAGTSAEVSYQHGLEEVLDRGRRGAGGAAVLIRPVSIAEIERTAREGLLMPPKSTFFTPKLKTGLVLREVS